AGYSFSGWGQDLAGTKNPITILIDADKRVTANFTLAASPPPPAPTNLIAAPASQEVALVWNASSGATGYRVKRATTSGGPYTTIASPTSAIYVDTTLTNGTTYYYVVTAVNS